MEQRKMEAHLAFQQASIVMAEAWPHWTHNADQDQNSPVPKKGLLKTNLEVYIRLDPGNEAECGRWSGKQKSKY